MIVPALLLGLAVAALTRRPATRSRLARLATAGRPDPADAARRLPVRALGVLAGITAWLVIRGPLGLLSGLACAVLLPQLLDRIDDSAKQEAEQVERQLPLALDLLGACLAGGGTLTGALRSVGPAVGGPCGARFERVAASLSVGVPADEAFRELGDAGAAGSAARALCRAAEGGTPVAGAVTRVAADARRVAVVQARKRAKRAGVASVAPLGACFLPAFLLVGMVPTVIGLGGPLLHGL